MERDYSCKSGRVGRTPPFAPDMISNICWATLALLPNLPSYGNKQKRPVQLPVPAFNFRAEKQTPPCLHQSTSTIIG